MNEQPEKLEPDQETAVLAEYDRRQNRLAAFDAMVDMALDGVITMEEAIGGWQASEAEAA